MANIKPSSSKSSKRPRKPKAVKVRQVNVRAAAAEPKAKKSKPLRPLRLVGAAWPTACAHKALRAMLEPNKARISRKGLMAVMAYQETWVRIAVSRAVKLMRHRKHATLKASDLDCADAVISLNIPAVGSLTRKTLRDERDA